jgi:hypothetical protein
LERFQSFLVVQLTYSGGTAILQQPHQGGSPNPLLDKISHMYLPDDELKKIQINLTAQGWLTAGFRQLSKACRGYS